MRGLIILAVMLTGITSLASANRILSGDQIQNTSGGSLLSVPSTGTTFLSESNTATVTGKTISGSSNTLSNIPGSALSGSVSVANGGTGNTSFTLNGILFGNTTSAVQVTAAGSQYQVLQAGSGGTPAFGALNLAQSAAVTGQLGVANGGTGASTLTANAVLIGNGTSAVTSVSPGTSGNVLTSNGTSWVSQSIASAAPSLNGGSASPQTVTAAGGVSLSSISYTNFAWLSAASAVTVTKTPSITVGTADGQILHLVGTSNTNTVTLQDQANLASSGLSLNGNWVGAKDSVLTLSWDANQSLWVEVSRR